MAVVAVLGVSSSAFASTYTWNLVGSSSQLLGNTDTITSTTGNINLVFSGFITRITDVGHGNYWAASSANPTALYAKHGGGDETGLGIAADPTHDDEIFKNSFIQIDITNLLAHAQIDALQLVIGSVQQGEGFSIWGSNSTSVPGTLLYTGNSSMDDVSFNVPSYGSYKYISVSATANNVLLDSVTASSPSITNTTPEPGTMALLLAGVALCAVGSRARRATRE